MQCNGYPLPHIDNTLDTLAEASHPGMVDALILAGGDETVHVVRRISSTCSPFIYTIVPFERKSALNLHTEGIIP